MITAMKLREAVRLALETDMSNRAIGRFLDVAFNTVNRARKLAQQRGLDWAAIQKMDDAELVKAFYRHRGPAPAKPEPDWASVFDELAKPGVTMELLWEEYRKQHPGGYSYTHFVYLFQRYKRRLNLVMRQSYRAGQYAFVDYAGQTVRVETDDGTVIDAQVFVGCLGCSNYSFAFATPSQATPEFVDAHVRMFEFFGGVPAYVVPDNLKAAVITPGRDPTLNRTFLELARHHGFVILPARVRKPRDKAKVEAAVRFVERWILARLRNRRFRSLAELNAAIYELLLRLNERPFKRLAGCRRSRFEELERAHLQPLPAQPFEYAEWTPPLKVGPDYHVLVRGHFYSVPYTLAYEAVEARLTTRLIELYRGGRLVATHLRSDDMGGHTTVPEHQLPKHRAYAERSAGGYLAWAERVGPSTVAVMRRQFERHASHPLVALNTCGAFRGLAKEHGDAELEAACRRAEAIGSFTLKSVKSMLRRGIKGPTAPPMQGALPLHGNVRGAGYYAGVN